MAKALKLNPNRLFSANAAVSRVAAKLYDSIAKLPIISPHGHTDPRWFADNHCFENASELLIKPDHYVFRMLYSQGIGLDQLGMKTLAGPASSVSPEAVWDVFAKHYYLFRGTPSRMWLDYVFANVFNMPQELCAETATQYYETITTALQSDDFRPRQIVDRFNIEVLSTTESPLDDLRHHRAILESDWNGRIISAFRPDPIVDPEFEGFRKNLDQLAEISGIDTSSYSGYIEAIIQRRQYFISLGVTSSDHGHPTPLTLDLSAAEAEALYQTVRSGDFSAGDAERFRAHMLMSMAEMSVSDGLVMQLHPGSYRNHNQRLFELYGRDKGCDIPCRVDYVNGLRPLLNRFGNDPGFKLIVFTLDESTYTRELAPLAGHYPCLKLGPAWWFHDSPEGLLRFRQQTTETAGFYNTVGFNDDTRALLSIPARHDVARRIDCRFLAELVLDGRLMEADAYELAADLSYNIVKKSYNL